MRPVPTLFVAVMLGAGCRKDPTGPNDPHSGAPPDAGGAVTFAGRVSSRAAESAVDLVGGVVELRGDFDGDGTVADGESVAATTDRDGRYTITADLEGKATLVLAYRAEGHLPHFERRTVLPTSALALDVELFTTLPLAREGDDWVLLDERLRISGLPQGLRGVARTFDPVTEPEAFPGDFIDSDGFLLRSAAFAGVELTDAGGNPVHQLDEPAVVRMELSREGWRALRDVVPDTDRIEVPLYTFDEAVGQWIDEGVGHLVDLEGNALPEELVVDLAQRRYGGRVFLVAEVDHFSWINADLPQQVLNGLKAALNLVCPDCGDDPPPPPTTPRPKIRFGTHDERAAPAGQGEPVVGATVTFEQFYADGTPAGEISAVVEADGSFLLPMGVSEGPGEDLDANGRSGETLYGRLTADWRGVRFDLAEGELPVYQVEPVDLGTIDLTERRSIAVACAVDGVVTNLPGEPVADALVYFTTGYTNNLDAQTRAELCGADTSLCSAETTTDRSGAFHLVWPLLGPYGLAAQKTLSRGVTDEWYQGTGYGRVCPVGPLSLLLDQGGKLTVPVVEVTGQTISWSPDVPIQWLGVSDFETTLKWIVETDDPTGFGSPVVYGTLPPGATEQAPAVQPLATGDTIDLKGAYADTDGYPVEVTAYLVVP